MIVLVSFWTPSITRVREVVHARQLPDALRLDVYWNQLKDSFFVALIVVGACLSSASRSRTSSRSRSRACATRSRSSSSCSRPFLTSYLIRAVAWEYPLMGRQGAINQVLEKIGVISEPLDILGFSRFSVTLALIQLYILFMITPLFFMLAQVDRSSLEAARDLGASWWKSFREVILPQTMPGIVIGSIFCLRADDGRLRHDAHRRRRAR